VKLIKFLLFLFFWLEVLGARSCYSILTETGLFTPVYPYNFKDYSHLIPKSQCELLDEKNNMGE